MCLWCISLVWSHQQIMAVQFLIRHVMMNVGGRSQRLLGVDTSVKNAVCYRRYTSQQCASLSSGLPKPHAIECSAVPCSALQCRAVPCSTLQEAETVFTKLQFFSLDRSGCRGRLDVRVCRDWRYLLYSRVFCIFTRSLPLFLTTASTKAAMSVHTEASNVWNSEVRLAYHLPLNRTDVYHSNVWNSEVPQAYHHPLNRSDVYHSNVWNSEVRLAYHLPLNRSDVYHSNVWNSEVPHAYHLPLKINFIHILKVLQFQNVCVDIF